MKNCNKTISPPSLLSRHYKVILDKLIPLVISCLLFFCGYSMLRWCESVDLFLAFGVTNDFINLCVSTFLLYLVVKYFFNLLNVFINMSKVNSYDSELLHLGYTQIQEGQQGIGKTLLLSYGLLLNSFKKDRDMRLKYFLKYPFKNELTGVALTDFNVLESSYDFYKSNEKYIPHLMFNIDLFYKGKKNYPFDMQYIDQQKRLAESFVMGITEIANELPNALRITKKSKEAEDEDKTNIKNETFSLARQYFDLTIISDEQRTGETFNGFRSVVSSNRAIIKREKLLSSSFFSWLQSKLESKVLQKGKKCSKFLSRLTQTVSNINEDIGFYRFSYYDKNALKDSFKDKDLKTFVISCDIRYQYDNRFKRFEYKLYDKPIDYVDVKQNSSFTFK